MDLSEWEEKGDNEEHFSKTGLREINIQCKKKKKIKKSQQSDRLGREKCAGSSRCHTGHMSSSAELVENPSD